MEKVALFDFCETLVKFQTADRYVQYVCDNSDNRAIRRKLKAYRWGYNSQLIPVASMLFPHSSINKRLILNRLRGFDKETLESLAKDYYSSQIRPNLIGDTVSDLRRLQQDGFRIILLSGGYDIYLKYFAEEFGISDIISTSIGFKNNISTGTFCGIDCLFDNKIKMLEEYCRQNNIEIDRRNSFSYSDSKSDLPMLNYVGNRVVVHRKDRPRWYNENDYLKEILWEA